MDDRRPVSNDDRVIDAAQNTGPDGDEYRYLRMALREMGVGALDRLGPWQILAEARTSGSSISKPIPPGYVREFSTLRWRAVDSAVIDFLETQVLRGGWRSGTGTSIRQLFMHYVVIAFACEYEEFYAERARADIFGNPALNDDADLSHLADEPFVDGSGLACRAEPSHGGAVDAREWLRRLLPDENHPLYRGVLVTAQRYAQRYTRRGHPREAGTAAGFQGASEAAGRGELPAGSRALRIPGIGRIRRCLARLRRRR